MQGTEAFARNGTKVLFCRERMSLGEILTLEIKTTNQLKEEKPAVPNVFIIPYLIFPLTCEVTKEETAQRSKVVLPVLPS